MGYFDHEHNSMGALTEFLGNKVTLMQGLVGEKLGMIAQAAIVSTAIVSLHVHVAMVSIRIVSAILIGSIARHDRAGGRDAGALPLPQPFTPTRQW